MKLSLALLCGLLGFTLLHASETVPAKPPVRIAIVGLVHGHAGGFIPKALKNPEVQIVGIVEPDQALCATYAQRFNLGADLFFPSIEALLAKTKVEAVAVFTNIFDHKQVVETCAPHGIHVMMEKPLAVNMAHARAIQAAARQDGIQIIVNYETTWYPANQAAYQIVYTEKTIGEIRKIVVHDGHQGPQEIGCKPEFLRWLTDPVLNGGGALIDFGCYGAGLATWLMQGQRPTSVFAVTQHIKPEIYPKVDDEATIVLTYPKAQGIIQASWNWPYSRKDMEIYGQGGYVLVPRSDVLHVLKGSKEDQETALSPEPLSGAQSNPVSYLAAVVRGDVQPTGPSSLAVNMIATEILDAARESAATGKRIELGEAKY